MNKCFVKHGLLTLLFAFLFLKFSSGQKQNKSETYYSFMAFGKKSEISILQDSIIRKGVNFSNDSFCNCTTYKIYKVYDLKNFRFFVTSPYHGQGGYEVISFQKINNTISKVAFTEVLGWESYKLPKKRGVRKQYLDSDILPYSQLFAASEIGRFESYTHLQYASTFQILNALDTLIQLKKNWAQMEREKPNAGKLGTHFYSEYISQALIRNQINPFFDDNFFEALKKRPDYEKLIEKINLFWSVKIAA
jgi:hypothetical protein